MREIETQKGQYNELIFSVHVRIRCDVDLPHWHSVNLLAFTPFFLGFERVVLNGFLDLREEDYLLVRDTGFNRFFGYNVWIPDL